jgi:hypothetical protein
MIQVRQKVISRLIGAYPLAPIVSGHIADGHARGLACPPQNPSLAAAEDAEKFDVAITQGNIFLARRRKNLGSDFQSAVCPVRVCDHIEAGCIPDNFRINVVWNAIDTDEESSHRFFDAQEVSADGSLLGALSPVPFFLPLPRFRLDPRVRRLNLHLLARRRILAP